MKKEIFILIFGIASLIYSSVILAQENPFSPWEEITNSKAPHDNICHFAFKKKDKRRRYHTVGFLISDSVIVTTGDFFKNAEFEHLELNLFEHFENGVKYQVQKKHLRSNDFSIELIKPSKKKNIDSVGEQGNSAQGSKAKDKGKKVKAITSLVFLTLKKENKVKKETPFFEFKAFKRRDTVGLSITGYPCNQQRIKEGSLWSRQINKVKENDKDRQYLSYDDITFNSKNIGAPIWYEEGGHFFVVGVDLGQVKKNMSKGLKIDDNLFRKIKGKFMTDTDGDLGAPRVSTIPIVEDSIKIELIASETIPQSDIHGISGIDYLHKGSWKEGANFKIVTDKANNKLSLIADMRLKLNSLKELSIKLSNKNPLKDCIEGESIRSHADKIYITSEGGSYAFWSGLDTDQLTSDSLMTESPKDPNAGLEGMDVTDQFLYLASERDDTKEHASIWRLNKSDYKDSVKQWIYLLDHRHTCESNGISEILHYNEQKFLIMEREYCEEESKGADVVISLVDLDEDKIDSKKLIDVSEVFRKRLGSGDEKPANFEGMTWGPDLDGSKTLILVSDDNGGSNGQKNWVLVFKVIFKAVN